MEPPTIPEVLHLTLPGKEHCPIAYTFAQLTPHTATTTQDILLVYVNGLGLPQAFWQPSITLLTQTLATNAPTAHQHIYATTYDRYGQGLSKPSSPDHPVQLHGLQDSVTDLSNFITSVRTIHALPNSSPTLKLVLVAHSIGVPLTRLYIQAHPNDVTAALLLDSNMANTDFVSLLPDPASPTFNPATLPADTTLDQLVWARANCTRMFHPSVPNPEKLDRSTLPSLLPYADKPRLTGAGTKGELLLAIVAHDPNTFAEESMKISSRGLTEGYVQPAWEEYNAGLCGLSAECSGVVVAEGSGHFVQKDNPKCVADEVVKLLGRIR